MPLTNFWGLVLVLGGGLLLIAFSFLARQGFKPALRPLSAYDDLGKLIGQAVESGGRVHISLGSGGLVGEEALTTLSALSVADFIFTTSSVSDLTPVGTTGDATALPALSDVARRAYQRAGTPEKIERTSARLVALDPMGMAGAGTSIIADDVVRANVLIGSFGSEMALLAEAGQRKHALQVGGSDRLEGQAVAYVMTEHSLIGEEVYVSRAYLTSEPAAIGSIAMQDILRWVIIATMVIGFALTALGVMR